MPFEEKRVMSGSFGEVWLDGELVAEAYKCQAKVQGNRTDIPMCGEMWTGSKLLSMKGTGSIGMHKVNSRLLIKVGAALNAGKDLKFTLITKLNDPDAFGAERIALYNVSFDDLTIADWEAGVAGKIESPFTFRRFQLLDKVEVQ